MARTPLEDRKHGSRSTYILGCKCGECREANRSYITARRAAGPGPEAKHGTLHVYQNLGCRCPLCTKANNDHVAKARARRRARRDEQWEIS